MTLTLCVACTSSPSNPGDDSVPSNGDPSTPTVEDISVSNPYVPANTMMYAVTVTASGHGPDSGHDATVGHAPRGTDCTDGEWNMGPVKRFETEDTLTWILYNFQPRESYDYKVQLGSGDTAEIRCGQLGTPAPPATLSALKLNYTKGQYRTKYVVLDTDDCVEQVDLGGQRYLIAIDADSENIVWYLDVAARSTLGGSDLSGWRYQPASSSYPGRFLATVDKRYFYEWAWDGTVVVEKDVAGDACDGSDAQGPCIHHDVFKSDTSGRTFFVASMQSTLDGTGTSWDVCGTGSRFLDDGFQVWNEDFSESESKFLMRDYGYDPALDGGPNVEDEEPKDACDATLWSEYFDPYGTIDWTHLNSIAASTFAGADVIDLSVKEFDQVLRVDDSGAVLWRLAPDPAYSDWAIAIAPGIVGAATFAAQHDVHAAAGDTLMMFDNTGDSSGSRVLRLSFDTALQVATIDRSWAVVDNSGSALTCRVEGSAQPVPGTEGENVLTVCNNAFTIVELGDATGNTGVPPLAISLPEQGYCTTGGPEQRQGLRGWYRVFPVDEIGDF